MATTQYGKVRGYVEDGVFTFKGVPYGADTGGENRWLPAKPPTPWDGELPTLTYGANCPQRLHGWTSEQTFLQQWTDGWQSEDMLKVNIWTPSLTGKRPVMFYIHGGGFTFGSAYELASQDGAQMARHHDVVSVTVNHRLNILGFLDLSEFGGPAYADSVNVGMTDLVAALRWVRDNIANFGGDPDCVMIYGQSGGGSKVTTLMGMPSAQGLIHRASAQSGGGGNPPDGEQSRELARQVMAELGVKDMAALQKMEWARLNEIGNAVVAKVNPPMGAAPPFGAPGAKPRVGWGPTVDGRLITMRSFLEGGPGVSKNVPMLIGSVSEEGNRMSVAANRGGVAGHADEELRRGQGHGARRGPEESPSDEEHPDAVLHVQRRRIEQPDHPHQRDAHGHAEVRAERRAGVHVVLHLAIADAGGCRGLAHGRARLLLRQHGALQPGHGQHAGSAGPGEEDGHRLGEFRPHGQSQPARPALGAVQSGPVPHHGLRQRLPHGGRPRRRGAQDPADLSGEAHALPEIPARLVALGVELGQRRRAAADRGQGQGFLGIGHRPWA